MATSVLQASQFRAPAILLLLGIKNYDIGMVFSDISIAKNFVKIGPPLNEVQKGTTDRLHGDFISPFSSLRKESRPHKKKTTVYQII
jgi:hypothetical protein